MYWPDGGHQRTYEIAVEAAVDDLVSSGFESAADDSSLLKQPIPRYGLG
ncbi:MAG: hypothetical protein HY397_00930 [Candidatus Doudnabacteria bacterium]|nr:hypothetical protein [Candidatus Doudnabacteria bacterium]